MIPLLALWLVPLVVALVSRRLAAAHVWRNTGFAFGLVVAPASLGLYVLFYVGPLVAVLGMLGLPLALFHGWPGHNLALALGLIPPTVVTGISRLTVEALNAVVWSFVYGALGWFIDVWRFRRQQSSNAV
jgi:hypothetical protein